MKNVYCKSCKTISGVDDDKVIESTGCPSCGITSHLKLLEVKRNHIPDGCENKFIRCCHCEEIMLEHQIDLAGDLEIECCPYCGRDGGLSKNIDHDEILSSVSRFLRESGFEEASKKLISHFDLCTE